MFLSLVAYIYVWVALVCMPILPVRLDVAVLGLPVRSLRGEGWSGPCVRRCPARAGFRVPIATTLGLCVSIATILALWDACLVALGTRSDDLVALGTRIDGIYEGEGVTDVLLGRAMTRPASASNPPVTRSRMRPTPASNPPTALLAQTQLTIKVDLQSLDN